MSNVDGDHPVERVIKLLRGLEQNVKAEGASEELTYAKFERWCATSFKTLDASMASGKETIDALQGDIEAASLRLDVLGRELEALNTEVMEREAALLSAGDMRRNAAGLYAAAHKDLGDTIAAIEDAISYMENAKTNTVGGLVQMNSSAKDAVQMAIALAAEVASKYQLVNATRPKLEAEGDNDDHIQDYAFKSHSVIEMLKDLKAKFEAEQLSAEKGETNSLNAFALSSDAQNNAIDAAKASLQTKTTENSTLTTRVAEKKSALDTATSALNDDTSLLSTSKKQCALKKSEWEERSAIRKSELEALAAAVDILAKVSGVRTEAPSNPVPPASPVAFLQLNGPTDRVVQLLRAKAHETHSRAMERLAQEISVHRTSPFAEVNNMIQKMIFRLMDEQTDEDKHKNWCDHELDKTNTSKVNKEEKIEELSAKINADEATVQLLTNDIASCEKMVSDIVEHMSTAKEIREAGKQENARSIKDAEDAQAALADAIAVLEAFYKESGMMAKQPWEFVQRGVELPANPATWESSYVGVADPVAQPGGIVEVLKKVSADFSKMEADTQAQEATDQAQFEEDMKQCDIEKAERTTQSQMKNAEKKRLLDKISSTTATRKQVSNELESVEQYTSDLQHACVDGDSTYADRKSARAKEIEALKEAQEILGSAYSESAPASSAAASSAFLAPVHRVRRSLT